uniref:NTF2 domain-containing protein n=1 Tax=Trypanosoma congolense (strain IL3000) TaxID=1068625 RepID=G0UVL0_TRYCI|nr:conserved hypothetical protein [Trypanosoma congolense IL3000]
MISTSQAMFGRDFSGVACSFLVVYYRGFAKVGEMTALHDFYSESAQITYAEYNETLPQTARGRHEIAQYLEKMDAVLSQRKIEVRFCDYSPLSNGGVHIVTQGILYLRGQRQVFTHSFVLFPTPHRNNTYHIASEYLRILLVEVERIPEGGIIMTPAQVAQHLLEEHERRKREEESRERLRLAQLQQQQLLQSTVQEHADPQQNDCTTNDTPPQKWDKRGRGQERRTGRGERKARTSGASNEAGAANLRDREEAKTSKVTKISRSDGDDTVPEVDGTQNKWDRPRRSDASKRQERSKRSEGNRRGEHNERNESANLERPEREERPRRKERRDTEAEPRNGEGRRERWEREEERVGKRNNKPNARKPEGAELLDAEADEAAAEKPPRGVASSRRREPQDSRPDTGNDDKYDLSKSNDKPQSRPETSKKGRDDYKERRSRKKGGANATENNNNDNGSGTSLTQKETTEASEAYAKSTTNRPSKKHQSDGSRRHHERKGPTDFLRFPSVPSNVDASMLRAAIKAVAGEEPQVLEPFGRNGKAFVARLSSASLVENVLCKSIMVGNDKINAVPFYS